MHIWTIQTEAVYNQIMRDGVFSDSDPFSSEIIDTPHAYKWLYKEMMQRIGPAPKQCFYPLWGWYQWEPEKQRPDLRTIRWNCGTTGKHVLLEANIPSNQVLLRDAESWTSVLNKWLISDSESEHEELKALYDSLPGYEQAQFLEENWKRVFDVKYVRENDWRNKGYEIEAVFWLLRKEWIVGTKSFIAKSKKEGIQKC